MSEPFRKQAPYLRRHRGDLPHLGTGPILNGQMLKGCWEPSGESEHVAWIPPRGYCKTWCCTGEGTKIVSTVEVLRSVSGGLTV
jgi:hypothetical protein